MHSISHTGADRRRHERLAVTRPCKIYHAGSARYLSGYTRDLSASGALLEIDSPRPVNPDDILDVLVAWNDRALLHERDQIPARVTRVLRTDSPRQFVAVAFSQVQHAAIRAAA
ncbi:hypothetical protein PHYC_02928 [Phycisphaerales bacterium]|nr:hypothetical protein PHYC_02928 [Phycisphaerales bacterium]